MKPYIYYLVFSLIFYMQNFIYSLFSSFVFVPNLLEFIFIYIIVLLISKTPYPKTIFTLWQSLYLIHFSFISFFGRSIISSDIYLFFTHFSETFETLAYTLHMYKVSFIISIFIFVLIFFIKFKKVGANIYLLIALLSVGVLLKDKPHDSSFILLSSMLNISSTCKEIKPIISLHKHKALRDADINIVLVIGESMRAKEYQEQNYEMFENYFYKTIYAGATSTDVSVPLLLNGAIKPSSIDMSNNLFILAKQNNLRTTFISVQSEKSMKYIKPYLHLEDIDSYNIVASRDDADLVMELKKIDFKDKTNLVVMQMQGEHSPYIYYPHVDKNDDISVGYAHSMNYSNKIILEMIEHIKTLEKETIFIFTSDHGELLGEGGRYGHNTFKEQVYIVPFIYLNNSTCRDISPLHVESHNDIYRLIFHLLAYENKRKNKDKSIRVNGTMINEEDGYKIFDILPK